MRFRKLRIAWSVFWGLACVLLIVLWVRSYYRYDMLSRLTPRFLQTTIYSRDGTVAFSQMDLRQISQNQPHGWSLSSDGAFTSNRKGWYFWAHVRGAWELGIPHWLIVSMIALSASVPWLPWWSSRFSVRTLLIARTLVAVVLGLAVYATTR
jgi:hypothetical protein